MTILSRMVVRSGTIAAALKKLFADPKIGCTAYNLGTGRGTSVLEMVSAFEKASGKKIPIKLCPKRPGDVTAVYATTERAEKELGWKEYNGKLLSLSC